MMHRGPRVVALAMTAGFAWVGFASAPAGAQDAPVIEIPLDTVVRGEPGSVHELATEPVAEGDVGRECRVTAQGANNVSAHPDTDLLVRSGDSEVVIRDVEAEPDAVTGAEGTLTLGDEVSVHVRLGPDEVFSGGMMVSIECPPEPTTTTTEATTTTTEATTTTAPTTTTEAPTTTTGNSPSTEVIATPTLANTGSSTQSLVIAAGVALAAGSAALAAGMRLRRRNEA